MTSRDKKAIIASGIVLAILISFAIIQVVFFGAPDKRAEIERFVVRKDMTTNDAIAGLKEKGFIKNVSAFTWAFNIKSETGGIPPGGYKISKSMSAWQIARILSGESYMKWVTIPEGLRKEEIAAVMARELGWTDEEKEHWITVDTNPDLLHKEGVYFPDTYLIPVDEP